MVLCKTAFLLAATVLVCSQQIIAAAPQKPVRVDNINTYFKAPPDSIEKMIAEADAVVRVRVRGASPRDTGSDTATAYHLTVKEVLKASGRHPVDPTQIDVRRPGSERDRGTHIERSEQKGFPPFLVGREYLMFLAWNPTHDMWVPAYGPDSVFDLTDRTVRMIGTSKTARQFQGTPVAEFVAKVRASGR